MTGIAALLSGALFGADAVTSSTPASAAPGDPFPANEPVVFISQGLGETTLYQATLAPDGSEWQFTADGTSDVEYNGIGWNPADGYLYGFVTETGGPIPQHNVVRIGQEGAVEDTGIAGVHDSTAWSGDFNTDNGLLYAINAAGTSMTTYDVDSGESNHITVTGVPDALNIFDFAYSDGYFWALHDGTIVRIDPNSGQASTFDAGFDTSGTIGAAWRFGNGNLGFGANSGTMFQVSVENPGGASPTFELITTQTTPDHARNDGASVPGAPTDLSMEKTGDTNFVPGEEFEYQLTVTNNGPGVSSGWTITDELPDGITLVNVEGAQPASEATQGIVSMYGGRLAVGDQRVITLTVRADDVTDTCVTNFATVLGNEEEGNSDNISDTTESCMSQLDIEKSSTATAEARVGDTIEYTVTGTNSGEADFTEETPAVLFDDLAGVLDDASYNNDAVVTINGETVEGLGYEQPLLSWAGPLAAGASVELTYSVTLESGGDGQVRNVAWQPDDPEDTQSPECDPATEEGLDPVTGEPCATVQYELPRSSVSKSVDRLDLPAEGEDVTFTVTITGEGPGSFTEDNPATFTDSLTDVLDDSDLVEGSLTWTSGSAEFDADAEEIQWSGALPAGETATVEYTLSYTGQGNQQLRNLVCIPEDDGVPGDNLCDFVEVPGSGLEQWKSVETDDDPVVAGSELTYTLFFSNSGQSEATVNAVDYLEHVLDAASVTTEPSSTVLDTQRDGDRIDITGTVQPGDTATVSYQVTVAPDEDRTSDVAANFLLDPSEDPPEEPVCEPEDGEFPDCTSTPVGAIGYAKSVEASDSPVEAGSVLTYTVTVDNTGGTSMDVGREDVLTDVLDDATILDAPTSDTESVVVSEIVDERFSITGELAAGETATVTYTVVVNDEDDRGNNSANNFLVEEPGGPPPEECPEDDPSCTETSMPQIGAAKSSDPESGAVVEAGDDVTYTLTFTNEGQATGEIDFTDHLENVLDDASLSAAPTSDTDSVTAELSSDETLQVSGTLGAGETAQVTYTVTVLPDEQRGGESNNSLGNVVTRTGEDPAEECEEDDPLCTEHSVPLIDSWKSVEADSTPIQEGTVLSYTLFFENSGQGSGEVAYVDDLTHVLDDATVTSEPSADEELTVARDGQRIFIDGSVPAGETVQVTYEVTISPDGERGDDIAANFLLENPPGDIPPPPEEPVCQPEDGERPDCTVTPIGQLLLSKSVSADSDPVEPGTELTYTITLDNQGEGAASVDHEDVLSDVLNSTVVADEPVSDTESVVVSEITDERFTITGELAAGETATVTYVVVVGEEADRSSNTATNFVVRSGEDPPEECLETDPLCTSTLLPDVAVEKSSDPESGSELAAGEDVTYTLSFTNTGEDVGSVDFTDDLEGVLDDASVTDSPVSSDPEALAVTSGADGLVRVTGNLEAGQTVTVSYTVTVNDDGDRGDNVLGNVVAKTGDEDPDCDDEYVSCTAHVLGELESWKSVDPASGSTLMAGDEATYTLHFENTGEAPVGVSHDDVLTDVLDDAEVTSAPEASSDLLSVSEISDDRFTVTGELDAGTSATVSYTVTVREDGERGDDRLGNFVVNSGEEPPEECVPSSDERADCTVNHVSDVAAVKSSDPESGSVVNPGDEVTYSLTFTNRSSNEDADPAAIDYTDVMSEVLDDAELTGGPEASSENLEVSFADETLRVTGQVPSGESYTVTYTVTVLDYSDLSDGQLANVLTVTGEEPVCPEGSQLCTSHDVPPEPSDPPVSPEEDEDEPESTPPGLPVTGAQVGMIALVAAVLVMIGLALIIANRRRASAVAQGGIE
ncbi:DUF7927 domain-containing protein [Nesterenkonia haasae]|uniref:DUF7927 domain-containing protein n=1 Tax=Nesterenkonia haasae TaxID=2587813 RepID=UPI0013914BC9|nr:DUF11 domain-containing protein [Nesterenkonia haasae]